MRIHSPMLGLALSGSVLLAQIPAQGPAEPTKAASPASTDQVQNDLFDAPKEFREFVVKKTLGTDSYLLKTQYFIAAAMGRVEDGGLGITYANDKTRTVAEVWKDRKANCMSLTAFYVAAFRSIGLPAQFAEAPSINLWTRSGNLILNEHHVVAFVPVNVLTRLVADFSGRPHSGQLPIVPISESRFRALFHSNRAVELLLAGDKVGAEAEGQQAVKDDPRSGVAWNALGAVEKFDGRRVDAEQAFRTALSVDSDNGPACGNLETLCREEGRSAEADAFREMGLKIREKDPYFQAFLAKEALANGRVDEAITHVRRALKLQRSEPDFYLILAQAELDRGQRDEAQKAVEKAIQWSLPSQRKRMESKLDLIKAQES